MKFIYIDESGNTGWNLKDRNQPFHFLAALSQTNSEKTVSSFTEQSFAKEKGALQFWIASDWRHFEGQEFDSSCYTQLTAPT